MSNMNILLITDIAHRHCLEMTGTGLFHEQQRCIKSDLKSDQHDSQKRMVKK